LQYDVQGLTRLEGGRLHIQGSNFDALFGQQEGDILADPIASSSNNRYLFLPFILRALPVVLSDFAQEAIDHSGNSDVEEQLEPAQGFVMAQGELTTLPCIVGEEK